jgi:urea transport system permease protein
VCIIWLLCLVSSVAAGSPRETIVKAILAENPDEKLQLISSLAGQGDESIKTLLTAWREDSLFIYEGPDGSKIPVLLSGEKDENDAQEVYRVDDGRPLKNASGTSMRLIAADLVAVEHDSDLRRAMKAVLDLADLAAPDLVRRLQAIRNMGSSQDPEKIPALKSRLEIEQHPNARIALREAIAIIQLKSADDDVKLAALRELENIHTLSSRDFINAALNEAEAASKPALVQAARDAATAIERHRGRVDFFGTLFRSLSLGSILLVVALGLAITFGLMGVINMAHGEMIAVGAYTTYVVQNVFGPGLSLSPFGFSVHLPGFNSTGFVYQSYFIVAVLFSFLMAALVGIALERSVIQFLYRRPLESLLATWGVSLILQQLFRLTFGANNVQVSSPSYLSGNWTINDIIFGWNRVFVICFAAIIVLATWLLLTKTPLGLLIRAVMQNRGMAACMGVRTERVNMLTFGFGSGLAGLAGAFLSQIGNVGPSLGQSYIVDSFMVVVVGGVGNLVGTVISGLGIGAADQFLQQYAPHLATAFAKIPGAGGFLQNLAQDSAVFGKILVLVAIILFLQWRPAGLFVTRNRSLEG